MCTIQGSSHGPSRGHCADKQVDKRTFVLPFSLSALSVGRVRAWKGREKIGILEPGSPDTHTHTHTHTHTPLHTSTTNPVSFPFHTPGAIGPALQWGEKNFKFNLRLAYIEGFPDSSVGLGFPCGSAGKESTCNVGDLDLIPELGRSPEEGKGYPLQYSDQENSMDCIVHGVAKSQTQLSDFHVTWHILKLQDLSKRFATQKE